MLGARISFGRLSPGALAIAQKVFVLLLGPMKHQGHEIAPPPMKQVHYAAPLETHQIGIEGQAGFEPTPFRLATGCSRITTLLDASDTSLVSFTAIQAGPRSSVCSPFLRPLSYYPSMPTIG